MEEWAADGDVKRDLLQGRRVQLAEELSESSSTSRKVYGSIRGHISEQVRAIQERLEEFIKALNSGSKP